MNTKTNSFILILLVAMIATSCSDKDVFDATSIYSQKKSEYTSNFVKKYGEIDPNQTWDFSTDSHVYSLSLPKATRGATRAITANPTDYLTTQDWYEVDQNTLTWMTSTLTNGVDHKNLGTPFYMVVPDNKFNIVPIFEGYADFVWTLHIVVDDYDGNGESLDISVWTKHQDIQKKTTNDPDWANITEVTGNTQDATAVRAKPIEIDLTQYKGKKMYLYLENTENGQPRSSASSLAFKMLALNIPEENEPTNIPDDFHKKIIACEDQVLDISDNDFNDVVFMLYGKPEIPEVKVVEEPIYEMTSKRYMIEDLGSTDDFDFNDVVVDVFDIKSKTAIYEVDQNNVRHFIEYIGEVHSQEAIVRSLGGTLDITLQIGSTTWKKSESQYPVSQMVNTGKDGPINYEAELAKFDIVNKDWNYMTNNITAVVGGQGSGDVLTITFPKKGEAPMIIGFDVNESRNWMVERQSIPSTWFTE